MKYLAILFTTVILLVLTGCGTNPFRDPPPALKLEIIKNPDGTTQSVKLETQYELEQGGEVYFNKETGEYEVKLNSATVPEMAAGQAFGLAPLLTQMMQTMQTMFQTYMGMQAMGIPVQPPARPVQ